MSAVAQVTTTTVNWSETSVPHVDRSELLSRVAKNFDPAEDVPDRISSVTHPRTSDSTDVAQSRRRGGRIEFLPAYRDITISRPTFHAIDEWEGTVLERCDSFFRARLVRVQVATEVAKEEEAEIPYDEVQRYDQDLVVAGAVFRLAAGYVRTRSGGAKRACNLVFRRLPQWTGAELREADHLAEEVLRHIHPESDRQHSD